MNHRRKLSHGKRFPLSLAVVALASASLWAPGLVWAQGKNGKGVAAARPTTLSAAAGLAMGLIGKGKVTLQSAWEQKLLGRDDLLQLLSRQQLNGVPQERQSEVRLGLASLLAGTLAQGEEGLEAVAQWPSPVRLSIADYYRSVRDERAVGLYQELIQELDAQVEKSGPVSDKWINPLAHLALFYAEMGQPLQAIQLWERAEKYSRNPEWLADVALVMARAYTQAGDADKARAAYAQVPQYGYGWYSGLAIYDQAYPMIKQGKHSEARALLQQPLSGTRADEAKVGLLSLLAASYLRTGEVEAARLTAQKALDSYGALKNAPQDDGMKYQVQRAKEVIVWCQHYEKNKNQLPVNQ